MQATPLWNYQASSASDSSCLAKARGEDELSLTKGLGLYDSFCFGSGVEVMVERIAPGWWCDVRPEASQVMRSGSLDGKSGPGPYVDAAAPCKACSRRTMCS